MVAALAPAARAEELRLTLADAIDMALEHSYAVKSAEYDSRRAAAQYSSARAERFPTLSLDATARTVDELQSFDVPIPGGPSIELGSKETYQADFKLMVPLFTGGKISGNIGRYRALTGVSQSNLESSRLETGFQTRTAYLSLMLAQASHKAAESSRKRLDIIRGDVQNLYDNGVADSTDLLETDLAYQKVMLQLDYQKTLVANARKALNKLLGLEQAQTVVPTENIASPPHVSAPEVDQTKLNRPELTALEYNITTAENISKLATADYFPNLSAYGGYSVGKPNQDMFNKTWNDYFSAGLALNWSFNLGGSKIHNKAAADRTVQSLKMALNETREAFLLRARTARENTDHARSSFEISSKEYDITKRQFALAQDRQKQGEMSTNRLLELEEDLTLAEQSFEASKINYYLALTEYYYSIGSDKIFGGLADER